MKIEDQCLILQSEQISAHSLNWGKRFSYFWQLYGIYREVYWLYSADHPLIQRSVSFLVLWTVSA